MSSKTESTDQLLTCVDCGQEFTWSAGEQDFFRDKGFTETPNDAKPAAKLKRTSAATPPTKIVSFIKRRTGRYEHSL